MWIRTATTALIVNALTLGSVLAQGMSQTYWQTIQSNRYNTQQLDIANVKLIRGRLLYQVKHISGPSVAQFVIVGDCSRKMRKEVFNSTIAREPYIFEPAHVGEVELNAVIEGSKVEMELKAVCNWVRDGALDTTLTERIVKFEKIQQDLFAQQKSTKGETEPKSKLYDEFVTTNNDASSAPSVRNPSPVYPEISRRNGEQGKVILRVLVRNDGTAGPVLINQSSGYERLDHSAIEAVKQWTFNIATQDGNPIEKWYRIPISFSLDNAKD